MTERDIVERLRSPEVLIATSNLISPVAYEAADEIERLRRERDEAEDRANWRLEMNEKLQDLNTRLKAERDEARAKALEEAARIAKVAWLSAPYGEIADADTMCAVCEHAETNIRALKDRAP